MKSLLIGFLVIIILSFVCIYIFIPSDLRVSKAVFINASSDVAYRFLSDNNNWKKWLPDNGKSSINNNIFNYNNVSYRLNSHQQNIFDISISRNNINVNSVLQLLPFQSDSSAVEWTCNFSSGLNPITRVQRYLDAVAIKKSMTDLLDRLSSFLRDKENIYGIHIDRTSTKDTFLIVTKKFLPVYPTVHDVYGLIDQLQQHINTNEAKQTNPPIINITKMDSGQYQLMVALPIDKKLQDDGNIFFKRMVPGYFLITDVTGGNYSIDDALNTVQLYITENKKVSMAIPFQSLITDRSKEPDTSKWKTRIYFPVVR